MTIGGPAPELRRRLTAPGWSSWLPMRCRASPAWQQGWLPSKPPSHASLEKAYEREPGYPWTCDDGPRRRGTGERDLWRRWVLGDRALPSDELDPRGTWQLPNRECLAGGDRRLVGEEESEDIWRCLTRARCQSAEDLSLDRLFWRTPLSARFDPALRWARDASRSSEGLSCRSESGPMFADGTAGPTVGWGGASPTNWFQQVFMSRMNSSCQLWIMSGEGPCEVFTASGCVTVGATKVGLGTDGGTGFVAGWKKRGRGTRKNSAKAGIFEAPFVARSTRVYLEREVAPRGNLKRPVVT